MSLEKNFEEKCQIAGEEENKTPLVSWLECLDAHLKEMTPEDWALERALQEQAMVPKEPSYDEEYDSFEDEEDEEGRNDDFVNFEEVYRVTGVDMMYKVGTGTYGHVLKGITRAVPGRDEQVCAIKVIGFDDDTSSLDAQEEVEILRDAQGHENIVRFYANWLLQEQKEYGKPAQMVIAMEYLAFDLLDAVLKAKGLKVDTEKRLARHLIEGVKFLHSKSIVYNDMKCENLMVCTKSGRGLGEIEDMNSELETAVFKLIDFGLAERVTCSDQALAETRGQKGNAVYMSTTKWRALQSGCTYNPYLADGYAVGCVLIAAFRPSQFRHVAAKREARQYCSVLEFLEEMELCRELDEITGTPLLSLLYSLVADDQGKQILLSTLNGDYV